jgi:hypothetical protein
VKKIRLKKLKRVHNNKIEMSKIVYKKVLQKKKINKKFISNKNYKYMKHRKNKAVIPESCQLFNSNSYNTQQFHL